MGRGAGDRLGGSLLAGGAHAPACRWTTTSASSGARLEWIGLQRHLKVLGIFSRLKHRDGKPAYSADLPRFFDYAHKVASRYAVLRPLGRLLEPLMGASRIEAFH